MKPILIQKIKRIFKIFKRKNQNITNILEISKEEPNQLLDDMRSEYGYDDEFFYDDEI